MIVTRKCSACRTYKNLTVLHFKDGYDKGVRYFSRICRKCCREDFEKPNFIRQAVIGYKEEPYYIGENYEYKAPSYNEILKEYEIN
jgi:hypothetical protein